MLEDSARVYRARIEALKSCVSSSIRPTGAARADSPSARAVPENPPRRPPFTA
jgi:hypothetical protein